MKPGDLERAIRCRLVRNPPDDPDYYGIQVHQTNAGPNIFDVTVTFLTGKFYCCLESGCHFNFADPADQQRLRAELADHQVDLIIRRLLVRVEQGALWGRGMRGVDVPMLNETAYSYELGPIELLLRAGTGEHT